MRLLDRDYVSFAFLFLFFLLLGGVGLFVNVFISPSPLNVIFYKLVLSYFPSLKTELLWCLAPVVSVKKPDASPTGIIGYYGYPCSRS